MIGLDLGLAGFVGGTAQPPINPSIPANFSAVNADGWSATYASPPTFDPAGAPEAFTVFRAGFDATGTPDTLQENLTCMARLRQPWPDQASLTADQVVLSDYIYSTDTVAGAVNNSTRVAPLPVAMWLMPDLLRASGSVTARLAVAHMHARNGRPVAAVRFILTDGTNTVEQTVSAMSTITYPVSGRTVPHFAHTFDLTGFTANAILTLDAIVYPWVGAAFQASVHGSTPPSINFAPTRVFNDVSFGTAYAYVDPVAGNNATAVTSANPATAATSPYLSVVNATAGIRAFNNANFGRDNASGGVVRLVEGTTIYATVGATQTGTMTLLPLCFEAADPAARAATILRDAIATTTSPTMLVVRNMTLRRGSTTGHQLFGSSPAVGSGNFMVFENCLFDTGPATSFSGAFIGSPGRCWVIECEANGPGVALISGGNFKAVNHIGGTVGPRTASYNVAGVRSNDCILTDLQHDVSPRPASMGTFIGFSHMAHSDSINVEFAKAKGAHGLAVVGCVLERTSAAGSSPVLQVWALDIAIGATNLVLQLNTVVGQRQNILYNDAGASSGIARAGSMRFCAVRENNMKSDIFTASSTAIGNWPAVFGVSFRGNALIRGGSAGTPGAVGGWAGEIIGFGTVFGSSATPLIMDFVNDTSGTSFGGDYTPGASSVMPTIPAGLAPYPVDQLGRAVSDAGAGIAGAIQRP